MKIMKLNGCMESFEGKTYSWICGDQEYGLAYDKDGDLYGVEAEGIDAELLDNIVEEPWNYDFPPTMEDYIEALPEEEIELPWDVVYNLESLGQEVAAETGYFLMRLEARPRCYKAPSKFSIWKDEFDRTYQIDVPKIITKEELIALYEEIKDIYNIL